MAVSKYKKLMRLSKDKLIKRLTEAEDLLYHVYSAEDVEDPYTITTYLEKHKIIKKRD